MFFNKNSKKISNETVNQGFLECFNTYLLVHLSISRQQFSSLKVDK
jgi:hypothetical protein